MKRSIVILACGLACTASGAFAQVGSMGSNGGVANVRPGVPSGLGPEQQPGFGAPVGPATLTSSPPAAWRPESAAQSNTATPGGAQTAPGALDAPAAGSAATPPVSGSVWGTPPSPGSNRR